MDYKRLIVDAIDDPAGAFRAALDSDDAVAVAMVSIVDTSTEAPTAVARFEAFASHYGTTAVTAELFLVILEQTTHLADELIEAAKDQLRDKLRELPMNNKLAARAQALVRDAETEDVQRSLLLTWMSWHAGKKARKAAESLLKEADEPYNSTVRIAIRVMGSQSDSKARALLKEYAERHLEDSPPDPGAVHPDAALYVLNAMSKPVNADLPMIGQTLSRAAEKGLAVGDSLNKLLDRLTMKQVASLVKQLDEEGHVSWLAGQFLPALIGRRPSDTAATAADKCWPSECLAVFANTTWEQHGDWLYPMVLKELHRTGEDAACAEIRQRLAARCQATSSTAGTEMPRIGARALLKLSLTGEIPTDDESLVAALQELDGPLLEQELAAAKWRAPNRAQRVGQIACQLDPELLPNLMTRALGEKAETAVALISGAAECLDASIDSTLDIVSDNKVVLAALCETSASAAAKTLERWQSGQSMAAFRALKSTDHAEGRLAVIPTVVRSYKNTPAERAELLAAYGLRDERVELLCSILTDRSKPGSRPTADDIVNALVCLGEHLDSGTDPGRMLHAVGVICREATQTAIRRAAYGALEKAAPTAGVVNLLLERKNEEAPSARPAAKAALDKITDKLDVIAADQASSGRAEAAEQLARIDLARAVKHARDLIAADEAEDRMLAARILGSGGSPEDAERLEAASSEEPHREVRDELKRAVRRLLIGDSAAAHERMGELAGVSNSESWLALDPNDVYGPWVDPVVKCLNRVAQAESTGDFDTAIDKLDEVAKALLFRAIEVAGDEVGVGAGNQAKAARNELDYGGVLGWQQLTQKWRPVRNFGALHELRTAHIAARGSVAPPPERTADDLSMAYSLFGLGAHHCCEILRGHASPPESALKA